MADKRGFNQINYWNQVRHHAFSLYEKIKDPDKTVSYIADKYKLIPPLKAGLKAELLAYHNFREEMLLEPLLDAGVKADFMGVKNGNPTNFDVTTNLDYKDINDYRDVIASRGKQYEIILENDGDFEFFPLRFPICKECGNFAHYILYLSPPTSQVFWFASGTQLLLKYCPNCWTFDEIETYSYIVDALSVTLKEIEADQKYPETRHTQEEIDRIVKDWSIFTVREFEKFSGKLLSAISEGKYFITSSNGDGYYAGQIYWSHPLASKYVDDRIDYYYDDGTYILE